MAESEVWKQFDDAEDIMDAMTKIKKLRGLQKNPNREDMIHALQDAKKTAPVQIFALELAQGSTNWRPFSDFTNYELYQKLAQYEQGLENCCIEKIGKQLFDDLMGREKE